VTAINEMPFCTGFPQRVHSISSRFSTGNSLWHNNLPLTLRNGVFYSPSTGAMKPSSSVRQILLFPTPSDASQELAQHYERAQDAPTEVRPEAPQVTTQTPLEVVICGSFRKDPQGLKAEFDELRELGLQILSPLNTNIVSERDGFVYMKGEETGTPEGIESRHLEAITRSAFVWLHAPEGYVGPSAALEIGFARASGIPVYARVAPTDAALHPLVTTVASPAALVAHTAAHPVPPLPAIRPFQTYYARAAARRGYEKESAQDTLLLMLEEFGELARALRKRQKLRRDHKQKLTNEEQELADIFIYVVHMANVLGVDLGRAVHLKEHINIERFLAR
jgi:NTP pyrophosphatase (non-canonical NTP hydrolase)